MKNIFFNKSDLKYTFRLLSKSPGFTILSIVILAAGLGLSIFTFTMSYTFAYKPIPLTNGDSIFLICSGGKNAQCGALRTYEFAQMRQEITMLENVGIYNVERLYIAHNDLMLQTRATATEWNMFQLSETSALIGRALQEYDHQANADAVMVLGYEYWSKSFNSDAEIVGTVVSISNTPTTIVGVMPEGYKFPDISDIWLPISADVLQPIENRFEFVTAYGLLKDNESVSSANSEINNLMQQIRQRYPVVQDENYIRGMNNITEVDTGHISTLPMDSMGGVVGALSILMFNLLAALVFLLTCINVSTLFLARTNDRLRDISIKVALGAPGNRLLLQVMGESIAISLLGGVMALLVTNFGLELFNLFITSMGGAQFWMHLEFDISTVFGVFVFVVLTILITSALPSWRLINGDFNSVMRDGTRGAVGLKSGRFRRSLVVVSIVLITIVLYMGTIAGSFMQVLKSSLANTNIDRILTTSVQFDPGGYSDSQQKTFYQSLQANLLQNTNINNVLTLSSRGQIELESASRTALPSSDTSKAELHYISGSLATLGASLLEGRSFSEFDANNNSVVVVSRSLADRLWPDQIAIDQQLLIHSVAVNETPQWRRVVGVISNTVITSGLTLERNYDMVLLPFGQAEGGSVSVLTNHGGNIDLVGSHIHQTIMALDPELSYRVVNWADQSEQQYRAANWAMSVIFACGLFSFLLAIAGIFGLTKNTITSHTQEIGTRRALGATDKLISRAFIINGGKQVLVGFSIAMLLASPVTYFLVSISGSTILKTITLSGIVVMLVLSSTVLLSIYYPIKKVLELEPGEALRHQ